MVSALCRVRYISGLLMLRLVIVICCIVFFIFLPVKLGSELSNHLTWKMFRFLCMSIMIQIFFYDGMVGCDPEKEFCPYHFEIFMLLVSWIYADIFVFDISAEPAVDIWSCRTADGCCAGLSTTFRWWLIFIYSWVVDMIY